MNRKNKLAEETQNKKKSYDDRNGGSKRHEEMFPPKLLKKEWVTLIISYIAFALALLYVVEQFCSIHILSWLPDSWLTWCRLFLERIFGPCVWGTYIALGVVITALLIRCVIKHRFSVQKARLEDRSVVDAMIVEAETVEPRLTDPEKKPENFDKKKEDLEEEASRLRDISSRGWTEYQVLSLNQMLVDFLKVDDLIASTQLSLTELKDYAEDSARRYDWEQCYQWDEKIDEAINEIKKFDPRSLSE